MGWTMGGSVKAGGFGDGAQGFTDDHRQSFDWLRGGTALDAATQMDREKRLR